MLAQIQSPFAHRGIPIANAEIRNIYKHKATWHKFRTVSSEIRAIHHAISQFHIILIFLFFHRNLIRIYYFAINERGRNQFKLLPQK
jgi:hypothetical protein